MRTVPDRPPVVEFGPETCRDLAAALSREWLVTNGLGGYAMGTVAGALTRHYHGLLIATTRPPEGRTLLLAKLEERLRVEPELTPIGLSTNRWTSGAIAPAGHLLLESFWLERGIPVWRWRIGDAVLEKRVAMIHGADATLVEYRLVSGSPPCELTLDALVDNRSHHVDSPPDAWRANVTAAGDRLSVALPANDRGGDARTLHLRCPGARASVVNTWWRDVELPEEQARGYSHVDAHLCAGTFVVALRSGERICVSASLAALGADASALFLAEAARRQTLLDQSPIAPNGPLERQLVLAADSFIVRRQTAGAAAGTTSGGTSVIAGYPWFGEWGRDTMLSLPGLFLATGRIGEARDVLATWSRLLDGGLLPNRFPDAPGAPLEFNTADAALAFVRAVGLCASAATDDAWLRSVWPACRSVIDAHVRGTRHGIRVDPADGLLGAGEPGLQLTWMDAKVGSRVVTPRMGKPVEINALWYAALMHAAAIAERLGEDATPYTTRAESVRRAFRRFANPVTGCLFDVLDGPDGDDASVRCNQIIAAGLEHSPVADELVGAIVERGVDALLTANAVGMRTLDPHDSRYRGLYEGDVVARDDAYHQGTAWPWLLAFLARAARRARRWHSAVSGEGDFASLELRLRGALLAHLREAGLGSVSEILDGDAPNTPRGCPAQAWSVAAALEIVAMPPSPAQPAMRAQPTGASA